MFSSRSIKFTKSGGAGNRSIHPGKNRREEPLDAARESRPPARLFQPRFRDEQGARIKDMAVKSKGVLNRVVER